MPFVFKTRRRAHSQADVTAAESLKTGGKASRIGKVILDGYMEFEAPGTQSTGRRKPVPGGSITAHLPYTLERCPVRFGLVK